MKTLRSLLKSPGLTALVIGMLALGMGANAALFSIIDRVVLHPFAYRDPGRLVEISGRRSNGTPSGVSPAAFNYWQGRVPAFEASAIWHWRDLMLTGVDDPHGLMVLEVSPRTFDILGVPQIHGRLFQADDFRKDSAPTVIIGYRCWQRYFHGDPDMIGKKILLDQQAYTVVGIMGPEFMFNRPGVDGWTPLNPFLTVKEELSHGYNGMARLKAGATFEAAQREMEALSPTIPLAPGETGGWRAGLKTFSDEYVGEYARALWVLWGAVVFVLMIACANAANLLLARYSNRKQQFAVRASLGAGRARLVLQVLAESLVLGVGAGAVGLGVAKLMLWLLFVVLPPPISLIQSQQVGLTPIALLVTLGAVLLTTLLCAVPGCWDLWRSDLSGTLRSVTRGGSADRFSNRTRAVLVGLEFAFSMALLIGAGLMLQSLMRLMKVPLGFNPDHVLTARVSAPVQLKDKDKLVAYFGRAMERVNAIPGTRSAAMVTILPLGNLVATTSFYVEGGPQDGSEWRNYSTRLRSVSPRYFETMGARILQGRAFDERDTTTSPGVAIVNEDLARHYWPGQSPIGKHVSRSDHPKPNDWLTVVGMVESARDGLRDHPTGELYRPFTQDTTGARATSVVVRTHSDPVSMATALRNQIHALNPDQPVTDIKTMDTWVREASAQPRFNTILLEIFAGLAFVLAISGVFAVVSYAVTQRTHEIGVRSALGATRRDIAEFVVGIGLRPVLMGAVLGVAGALAGARWLKSQLFETPALDPAVLTIVVPVMLLAAVCAALIPARRATKVDPMIALRYE